MAHHLKGITSKETTLTSRTVMESTIIKPKFTNIVDNWIDKNDLNVLSFNNKYRFNLIYLKSRDGFDHKTFHDKCNRQGPFIILIRVRSNKIYGGYNPIGFSSRKRK